MIKVLLREAQEEEVFLTSGWRFTSSLSFFLVARRTEQGKRNNPSTPGCLAINLKLLRASWDGPSLTLMEEYRLWLTWIPPTWGSITLRGEWPVTKTGELWRIPEIISRLHAWQEMIYLLMTSQTCQMNLEYNLLNVEFQAIVAFK